MRDDLDGTPRECGFERGSWNARMIAKRILDRFGVVSYSGRSAIRLARRSGFSARKPRPAPYDSAAPEEQAEFVETTNS